MGGRSPIRGLNPFHPFILNSLPLANLKPSLTGRQHHLVCAAEVWQ
jgi:hypothetical protein